MLHPAPAGESRSRALVVSLLLAALLHVCVLVGLIWQNGPAPVREALVRIMLLTSGTAAVVAQPPTETPQKPAPPVSRPALVREAKPPARSREVAAPPQAPSAIPAPAASATPEAPIASASAPLAPAAVSARPKYKNNPEPAYPAIARRRRQQGNVLLSVRVDADGRPEAVIVQTSSGYAALDEAAVAAVKHWEFEPGRVAGEPVPSQVEVPVQFQLDHD
jgi:protein TonB